MYHSQRNGQVENINMVFGTLLTKLVNENKSGQKLDSLEIFTKFISGDITRETLKHELKRKHGLDNY